MQDSDIEQAINHPRHKLTPTKIIILGYIIMILIGALLLTLPIATRSGQSAGFSTALFTATSASCVTGLILQDTYTFWSNFGQVVIISLIQIGGLGFMTMAMLIGLVARKRIGIKQRVLMRNSISAPYMGGIVRLTKFVVAGTAIFELCGAFVLSFVFVPRFGFFRGIWFSLFHAVSAFCNAGFDLTGGTGKFSSLINFADNPIVNITIMLLIIIGGLGFFVWEDIKIHRFRFKQYKLQTKAVLLTSLVLILVPAIYFMAVNGNGAFEGKDIVLKGLFQSVTTRTAGFNTVDYASMTNGSQLVSICLMLVGGSPGSTAGGIKTTTLLVLLACVATAYRRRDSIQLFGRTVHNGAAKKAVAVLTLYLCFFLLASVAIFEIEGLPILSTMFESASAIGTVGLTLGITTTLSLPSQFILIFLMYFGRVGCLTLLVAFTDSHEVSHTRYPHEDISIG